MKRPDPADAGPDRVGLDDLLRSAPASERPAWAETVRAWAMPVLQTLAVSIIIYAFFYVIGFPLSYRMIAGICLAALLIRQTLRHLAEHPRQSTSDVVGPFSVLPRREEVRWIPGGDGMVEAIRRWDRELSWGYASGERFVITVGRRIGEITDERLRLRHGITRATDPERARQIMGEHLWHLTGPLDQVPTYRHIMAALADLERI